MDTVIPLLLGYGIGSLPLGYLVASRLKGIDLRRVGSGNVGAANVYRTAGLAIAALVVFVDAAKGASSVLFTARFASGPAEPVAAVSSPFSVICIQCGCASTGAKAATACRAFWMLAPLATAIAATVFALTVWIWRYVSLGSIAATLSLPTLAWFTDKSAPVVAGALVAAALIMLRHRPNIGRLHDGTERRLGQKA